MNEVLTAIIVCSVISVGLTIIILIVNATVGNYGECELDINEGSKKLKVEGGQSLLSSLNSEGIFIPSACGGKGSCGLCKLKVLDGAGELLPTEEPWLTDEEKADNIRLSCQVKVKNGLKIEIPEEYFLIKEFKCKVLSLRDLTHDIKELTVELLDPKEVDFKAGQFMQIKVPEYELSSEEVYRAYSVSSPPSVHDKIEFEIRLVPNGICTTYVHKYLKEGDIITINGPYGEFRLHDSEREVVCIAGGSGMAPIKSILMDMVDNGINRKTRYFFGAVSKKDLFMTDKMAELEEQLPDFKFIPALSGPEPEDKWEGETGLITEVLGKHLENGDNVEAYLCGSPGMINACVKVLTEKGVPEERIYYDKFA